jgi:adenine-specific DNA-methyltransferase
VGKKEKSQPSTSADLPKDRGTKAKKDAAQASARSYQHPQADLALRPDVGTQAQFRKKKPPATYRYDSSLSPSIDDRGNELLVVKELQRFARSRSAASRDSTKRNSSFAATSS